MINKPNLKAILMHELTWPDEGAGGGEDQRKLVGLDEIEQLMERAFEFGIVRSADHMWDMLEFYEKIPDGLRAIQDVRHTLYSHVGCDVDDTSSRVCDKGTRSCKVKHNPQPQVKCGICNDQGTLGSGSVDNPVEWCYACGGGEAREAAKKALSDKTAAQKAWENKQERRAAKLKAINTTYRNTDDDFGCCGNCHKPLITCQCDPDDLDDDDCEEEYNAMHSKQNADDCPIVLSGRPCKRKKNHDGECDFLPDEDEVDETSEINHVRPPSVPCETASSGSVSVMSEERSAGSSIMSGASSKEPPASVRESGKSRSMSPGDDPKCTPLGPFTLARDTDCTDKTTNGVAITTGRRQEVIEQLCKMMGRAYTTIDPFARAPCDCVCRETGISYQNAGQALTFMEEAISAAIARHEREQHTSESAVSTHKASSQFSPDEDDRQRLLGLLSDYDAQDHSQSLYDMLVDAFEYGRMRGREDNERHASLPNAEPATTGTEKCPDRTCPKPRKIPRDDEPSPSLRMQALNAKDVFFFAYETVGEPDHLQIFAEAPSVSSAPIWLFIAQRYQDDKANDVTSTTLYDNLQKKYDYACKELASVQTKLVALQRVSNTLIDHHGADNTAIRIGRDDWNAFRKTLDPSYVERGAEPSAGLNAVERSSVSSVRTPDATYIVDCKDCSELIANGGWLPCEKHRAIDPVRAEPNLFYACIACTAPLPTWGMCHQCSVAWGMGRADAFQEMGCATADTELLFYAISAWFANTKPKMTEDDKKRLLDLFQGFSARLSKRKK